MAEHWYALRSKPNREDALWREAASRGFNTFYPRVQIQPANPRARKVRPFFPGYMFVRADVDAVGRSAFSWIPHSAGLVAFGSEPAPVPDVLVDAIRRRVGDGGAPATPPSDGLKPRAIVRIATGPFSDCLAVFDRRLSGNERVRVLLRILDNRTIPLELPSWQVSATTRQ